MKNMKFRMSKDFKCCKCTKEEKICYICDCEYEYFLNKANIVGIGLGYKIQKEILTSETCIAVFVSKKISDNELNPEDLVPPVYNGIKTDIVETGVFNTMQLSKRIRPVVGGCSIGPITSKYYGTMGCLVTNGRENFILSNNHVLADLNNIKLGTPIVQPAIAHGGDPEKDQIAVLSKFIPLKSIKGTKRPENYVDAAIAKVINNNDVSSDIKFIGKPKGVRGHRLGQLVKKVGASTELTAGIIKYINVAMIIDESKKQFLMKKQIVTNSMSKSGDSGSILLNDNNYALGLLMASNNDYTIFNPIKRVLAALDVSIVSV
ncbi:trypsin-like serine protease [Clostridium botulinum]|uniref:trypsin-like serine protease n=1 Tax=Clostridium botulinum TaxID=1491 RepID=UPI000654258B|nr:trypsin-like serine protease [Clostridium botulinum]QPW59672.1 trypsin-like serine protease [Clostridium botulinum]